LNVENHHLYHPKHAERFAHKKGGGAPIPQPVAIADILAQANNLIAIAAQLQADAVALAGSGQPQPVPAPAPTPRPQPSPGSTINWPSFTGTAQFVGTSSSGVSVYVDPTLGAPGLQNAADLLADADRVAAANNAIFNSTGGPTNVIIFALGGMTDGTGGADHMACDFTNGANIEVCAAFGQSNRCSALFEAELSECSMNGQLCGLSTGEALSRWCAMVISNNALADFAAAPTWAQDGYANWVDNTNPTDTDYDSIGCGMAFISWMRSLGTDLPSVAQHMVALGDGGTLAQCYNRIFNATGSPWARFLSVVQALPGGVVTDDPFGKVAGDRWA
jgi:hypothetical protein